MSYKFHFERPFVATSCYVIVLTSNQTGAQLMEVDLDRNGKENRWIYDLLDLLFEFILSLQGILCYSTLRLILCLPYTKFNLDYYRGKAVFFVFSR